MSQEKMNNEVHEFLKDLYNTIKTVHLASLDGENTPHASYVPYAFSNDYKSLYFIVSDLSRHTKNLKNNSKLGLAFIESEERAKSVYLRRRISFDANAVIVDKKSDGFSEKIKLLEDNFGDVVANLIKFDDFHLFECNPYGGARIVKGFGAAYSFEATHFIAETFSHIADKGHVKSE